MKTKKLLCLFLTVLSTSGLFAATFDNLIIFGDSLSDAATWSNSPQFTLDYNKGNNYWIPVQGKIGTPITSEDPQTHQATLWPNDVVKNTTLFAPNPNQTRLIYPSSQARRFGFSPKRYNIDYAWASAETGDHYINDINAENIASGIYYADNACNQNGPGVIDAQHSCVPSVLTQVQTYLEAVDHQPNPHSLIIIWAGANDVFNNVIRIEKAHPQENQLLLLTKIMLAAYPSEYLASTEPLSNPVKNIKQAVQLLISAGVPAQNIYVINLPNLSHTPIAIEAAQGHKILLYTFASICHIFNAILRVELSFDYLHASFNLPNSHVISSNDMFNEVLNNKLFNHGLKDCVENKAIPYCEGYVFFNNKHPTTTVHHIIANDITKILSH